LKFVILVGVSPGQSWPVLFKSFWPPQRFRPGGTVAPTGAPPVPGLLMQNPCRFPTIGFRFLEFVAKNQFPGRYTPVAPPPPGKKNPAPRPTPVVPWFHVFSPLPTPKGGGGQTLLCVPPFTIFHLRSFHFGPPLLWNFITFTLAPWPACFSPVFGSFGGNPFAREGPPPPPLINVCEGDG